MDLLPIFIDSVKATDGPGINARNVVTIVGKVFSWRDSRRFTNDFFPFNHELATVGVLDHPFATKEGHDPVGTVLNGDKINERVRLIRWQTFSPVMIDEFVELSRKARNFGRGGHRERVQTSTNARKGTLQMDRQMRKRTHYQPNRRVNVEVRKIRKGESQTENLEIRNSGTAP